MRSERGDRLLPPFTGSMAHYFSQLESWRQAEQQELRAGFTAFRDARHLE